MKSTDFKSNFVLDLNAFIFVIAQAVINGRTSTCWYLVKL